LPDASLHSIFFLLAASGNEHTTVTNITVKANVKRQRHTHPKKIPGRKNWRQVASAVGFETNKKQAKSRRVLLVALKQDFFSPFPLDACSFCEQASTPLQWKLKRTSLTAHNFFVLLF
jgi:hypothetical protein